MHTKPDLRVPFNIQIYCSGSVIVDVIHPESVFKIPSDFEWLSPWHLLDRDKHASALEGGQIVAQIESGELVADSLNAELRREIPLGHRLYELEFDAIAYCSADFNEFLFVTNSPTFPLACVHLTWRVENDVLFPRTVLYSNADDWYSQMKLEHQGCRNGDFLMDG